MSWLVRSAKNNIVNGDKQKLNHITNTTHNSKSNSTWSGNFLELSNIRLFASSQEMFTFFSKFFKPFYSLFDLFVHLFLWCFSRCICKYYKLCTWIFLYYIYAAYLRILYVGFVCLLLCFKLLFGTIWVINFLWMDFLIFKNRLAWRDITVGLKKSSLKFLA